MKQLFYVLVVILFPGNNKISAQSTSPSGFFIKVYTDSTIYKAKLKETGDSTIRILNNQGSDFILIPVKKINLITVRRPFLKTVAVDMLIGIAAGLLAVAIDEKENLNGNDDPPFGRRLWWGISAGAGAGMVTGIFQGSFFRIKLPINQKQNLFEFQKSRLAKYITY